MKIMSYREASLEFYRMLSQMEKDNPNEMWKKTKSRTYSEREPGTTSASEMGENACTTSTLLDKTK